MPSLSTLVSTRLAGVVQETNLEEGVIYTFHSGAAYSDFRCLFCWQVPSAGTATIEIWGAGGSGAKMCCCGSGVGGNSGAYSKKTLTVAPGGFVTGCIGRSCGNANDIFFRGCSIGTCITICTGTGGNCLCMCAMGGRGGLSYCVDGTSIYCCMLSGGSIPGTLTNTGCGIVCNYIVAAQACAYGGDINCTGTIACTYFYHCNPECRCSTYLYHAIPSGMFTTGRPLAITDVDGSHGPNYPNGAGLDSSVLGLGALSHSPNSGFFTMGCWSNHSLCQCYENVGCASNTAPGVGGAPAMPCSSVRNHGFRGGHGVVRIKFIGS